MSAELSATRRKLPAPSDGAGRDVVFTFSYETYEDAVARGMMRPPDRILGTLLRSPEVDRLLVADPFRWMPSALARRALGARSSFPATGTRTLAQPLRLRRADPVGVDAIAAEYRRYDRALERAAREAGLDEPAVITTNPLVAGFAPLAWAGAVTYFGRDDWLSSPARKDYWPAYRAAYDAIASSGRAVAAVSEQIVERIAPQGPSLVVPNGIEPGEWLGDRPDAPEWFASIPSPRAVYVGTLDSRLDVGGIAEIAAARPELQIVLLGPLPDAAYVAALAGIPSVHVHPGVGRAELVAVLRNADLCLLSHRRTPLTEAMSPLKVYEYLAAGKPVLAVDFAPVRGLGDRVLLADSVADFAELVDPALAARDQTETERRDFIERNSWASRHEAVIDLVMRPKGSHCEPISQG